MDMTRNLSLTSQSLLIVWYYKTPNSSKYLSSDFNKTFNDTLKLSQKKHKEVIILADFNVNYLKKHDNKDLKTIININGFENRIKEPIRITQRDLLTLLYQIMSIWKSSCSMTGLFYEEVRIGIFLSSRWFSRVLPLDYAFAMVNG